MAKHLIRHYGKYIYRHEDYQAICQGDDCASQILSLFEFWTTCRLEEIKRIESYNEQSRRGNIPLMQPPDLWLYETITDISEGMLDAYGDSSIRRSLKKLIVWEFIDSRKSKHDFDRTKEYKFNTELIQSSLDQWWNSQSIENSEAVKRTHESVEKTLEPVKRTHELVKKTHESLNLQDDLYSSNSLNKQSVLTKEQAHLIELNSIKEEERSSSETTASLITKTESSVKQITPHGDGCSARPLQSIYAQAANVWELVDLCLDSPDLADAKPPSELLAVYNEKYKWSQWRWPWRSLTKTKEFGTFNPEVVKKLATQLAVKDKATPAQKYDYAIATINLWEQTKGGWTNLMTYCDRPVDQVSTESAEELAETPRHIKGWHDSYHEILHEKFRAARSLEVFFAKDKDNKPWYEFAKEKFPSWDWSK
jgi:hypothetical protein